jgi:hypothetical protein
MPTYLVRATIWLITRRKELLSCASWKSSGLRRWCSPDRWVGDQRNWDVFCPIFQIIVAVAQDIMELDLKSTAGKPTFCIDMALVGPLFEVSSSSKFIYLVRRFRVLLCVVPQWRCTDSNIFQVSCGCRDPIIRRRAISILRNCGRTEGVWNAFLTSKVAQRVCGNRRSWFGRCQELRRRPRLGPHFQCITTFRSGGQESNLDLQSSGECTR